MLGKLSVTLFQRTMIFSAHALASSALGAAVDDIEPRYYEVELPIFPKYATTLHADFPMGSPNSPDGSSSELIY